MKLEDWKQELGADNLVYLAEPCDLPPAAQDFLISYGMPRQIIFENPLEGQWKNDFNREISFKDIAKPLLPCNADVFWGNFYDEEMDRLMAQEIVIGQDEINQRSATVCVHRVSGVVTRIDDDEFLELQSFFNSSLPQYGECLLLAMQWSQKIHQTNLENWKTSLHELAAAIETVDPEAVQHPLSEWFYIVDRALAGEPGFLEITADPKRSRKRY